jgi:hypothetical protein
LAQNQKISYEQKRLEDTTMGRYPYTYAADLIRSWVGYDKSGTKLSRADASKITEGFAEILGMTKEKLSKCLADHYIENQQEISDVIIEELKRNFSGTSMSVPNNEEDDYMGADHD